MSQSSFQGFLSPRSDKKGSSLTIKSKQNLFGNFAGTSTNVSISAVDLTKAVCYLVFYNTATTTTSSDMGYSVKLTSPTNVLITRSSGTDSVQYSVDIIEYYNVKSLQTGQKTITTTSDSVTISPVNTAKSILVYTSTNNSATTGGLAPLSARLTNSTTITTTQSPPGSITFVMEWQVIEFN